MDNDTVKVEDDGQVLLSNYIKYLQEILNKKGDISHY